MKTKNLLVALSVAMLSTWSAYAQKVEAVSADGPVINCEGMPSEMYNTTTKGNVQGPLLINDGANAKLYQRFAVSKSNNHTGQSWAEAFGTCSKLGDGWRLPTQRELMLIWVLKRELELTNGFESFAAIQYWAATYDGTSKSCYVDFSSGNSFYYDKTSIYKVRCIMELK